VSVLCFILSCVTPPQACVSRIRARLCHFIILSPHRLLCTSPFSFVGTDHPTITNPALGLSVLARFRNTFELPSPSEGYVRYLSLTPLASAPASDIGTPPLVSLPSYTGQDILAILSTLQSSLPPNLQPTLEQFYSPHTTSGTSRGRSHARGRGHSRAGHGGHSIPPYGSAGMNPGARESGWRGEGRGHGSPYRGIVTSGSGWRGRGRGATSGSHTGSAPHRGTRGGRYNSAVQPSRGNSTPAQHDMPSSASLERGQGSREEPIELS
jgi:hypothetical protein